MYVCTRRTSNVCRLCCGSILVGCFYSHLRCPVAPAYLTLYLVLTITCLTQHCASFAVAPVLVYPPPHTPFTMHPALLPLHLCFTKGKTQPLLLTSSAHRTPLSQPLRRFPRYCDSCSPYQGFTAAETNAAAPPIARMQSKQESNFHPPVFFIYIGDAPCMADSVTPPISPECSE